VTAAPTYLRLVAWCARLRIERRWLILLGADPADLALPAWPRRPTT